MNVFSPTTIAVASIYSALHDAGYTGHCVSTIWLLLVCRTLHVDPVSVRMCLLLLKAAADDDAESTDNRASSLTANPASVISDVVLAIMLYSSNASVSSGLLSRSMKPSYSEFRAPITAGHGARMLARLHFRTFIEALAVEAGIRGADALSIDELVEVARNPGFSDSVIESSNPILSNVRIPHEDFAAVLRMSADSSPVESAEGNSLMMVGLSCAFPSRHHQHTGTTGTSNVSAGLMAQTHGAQPPVVSTSRYRMCCF